jgi:RNA polymerase sigma factor (sigma-70 family)
MKNWSDKSLLTAENGESAFRIIYERYWEALYKKALHRLGNEADAQDVLQEIFLSLWRNKEAIVIEETLAPYLYTALKYSIIKLVYREAKKDVLLPLSVAELEKISVTQEEILAYRELKTMVEKEVANLPVRMQEIYRLSRMEHLQTTEIAQRLHISEQTVKNTLTTTIKRLRSKLSHLTSLFTFF